MSDWSDRIVELAKRLLQPCRGLQEGDDEWDQSSDIRYVNAVVTDFETMFSGLLATAEAFVGKVDEASALPVNLDRTRDAAIAQLDAILETLEYKWGLHNVLRPLRYLRSALVDATNGQHNPLLDPLAPTEGRPKGTGTERGRHWRYLTALVIDSISEFIETANNIHLAAERWANVLTDAGYDSGADGADLTRRLKDYHREMHRDADYSRVVTHLRALDCWPGTLHQAGSFARRAAMCVMSMERSQAVR